MTSFTAIRKRAASRKGGEAVLESLLGPAPDNASLANVPDDRILSAMTERVFSAGFVWKVIRDKWPGFEEAFLGFEPKPLLFQPDDFWHDRASDTRIVRNASKIKSVRDNAAFVDGISAEHGSFGKFMSEWPTNDQIGLLAYLGKHGSRLGGATGQYFLRWIGWDAYMMSKDAVVAMRDSGLEIAENVTSKRDRTKVQEQMNEWADESGLSYAHMSKILAFSAGENYDADAIRERTGG